MNSRGSVVTKRRPRFVAFVAAALIAGLAGAACAGGEQPTPIIIVTTLPTVTPVPTPTPTEQPTESVGASESPLASPSASASSSASPSAGGSAVPGADCSGSQTTKDFYASMAKAVSFTVYCGKFPGGWSLIPNGLHYEIAKTGAFMTADYARSGTSMTIHIGEGAFCLTSPAACSPNTGILGTANFGPLNGTFYTTAGGGFAIYIDPGTKNAYEIVGTNMSQSTFTSLAAGMILVPKS